MQTLVPKLDVCSNELGCKSLPLHANWCVLPEANCRAEPHFEQAFSSSVTQLEPRCFLLGCHQGHHLESQVLEALLSQGACHVADAVFQPCMLLHFVCNSSSCSDLFVLCSCQSMPWHHHLTDQLLMKHAAHWFHSICAHFQCRTQKRITSIGALLSA